MMMNNFQKVLKDLRQMKYLSQKQLAAAIGVSQKAIDFWEKGINEPKLTYVVALCDFFDVTLDELIGRA